MTQQFAGILKERVRFERPVLLRTAAGLQQPGWEPIISCFAAIAPDGCGEIVKAMALSSRPRIEVTIRYNERIALGQRLIWQSRSFLIRQLIYDPRQRGRLVLKCEEMS